MDSQQWLYLAAIESIKPRACDVEYFPAVIKIISQLLLQRQNDKYSIHAYSVNFIYSFLWWYD